MYEKNNVVSVEIDSPVDLAADMATRAASHGVSTSDFWVGAAKHYLGGIYGALSLFADAGQSGPDGDEL